jgi:hypothetical protein
MKLLSTLLALLYTFWPIDFLPDWLLGLGWIDDLTVLIALWYFYFYKKGPYYRQNPFRQRKTKDENYRKADENAKNNSGKSRENNRRQNETRDPFEVLGIEPTSDKEKIKQAYRSLVIRYHPDKVAHLGKEFQELAEIRFKEIQQAYQELMENQR